MKVSSIKIGSYYKFKNPERDELIGRVVSIIKEDPMDGYCRKYEVGFLCYETAYMGDIKYVTHVSSDDVISEEG